MRVRGIQGLEFPATRFVVGERLSVATFARALGIEEPLFTDVRRARAAGFSGRPVPPTMYAFFHTVPSSALEEQLGFVWGRTLGAALDVEVGATVGEEDEVVGQSTVEAAWETEARKGAIRQQLRLRTDFRRPDGTLVCRWWALFMERREGAPDPSAAGPPPDGVGPEPIARSGGPPQPCPAATVGQALPSRVLGPVNRLQLARISVAIDNPDLIHLDDEVARAAGFPAVVGQGSGAAGVLYEVVRQWAGFDHVRSGEIRLTAPYSLGSLLTTEGSVTEVVDEGAAGRTAHCAVVLRDQHGAGVAEGRFRVAVR